MIHNVKAGKLYKGAILIDNDKLVYCRVYAQDYNTDQEAEMNAKGIATAINNYDSLLEALKKLKEIMIQEDSLFKTELEIINSVLQKTE